jgi:hypothetical protein
VYTNVTIKWSLRFITDLKVRQFPLTDLRVRNWQICGPHNFFVDNNGKIHPVRALKIQHFNSNAKNLKGKFVPVNTMKAKLHSFLTPVLGEGRWVGNFTLGERNRGAHRIGGWVDASPGTDISN